MQPLSDVWEPKDVTSEHVKVRELTEVYGTRLKLNGQLNVAKQAVGLIVFHGFTVFTLVDQLNPMDMGLLSGEAVHSTGDFDSFGVLGLFKHIGQAIEGLVLIGATF